jgi:uncharacterized protein (DUF169 family)
MSNLEKSSASLVASLQLASPPIAISIAADLPAGVPVFEGSVPAGCRFWQEAAAGVFATATADHSLCAIGVYTHNLASPSEQTTAELGAVLKVMAEMTYVRDEDVAQIPRLEAQTRYVIYSPLAEAPMAPDVVMLFAHSAQGLVIAEAAQQVEGAVAPALGRPACAIVPQVINTGRAAVSLGCCGARAYLDSLSDAIALWALPGSGLDAYVERIEALAGANSTLAKFHMLRRQDVEAGAQPTFEESLARLQG